jgi:hypothetical protein
VDFIGSIKWRERDPFDGRVLSDLVAYRRYVPGADDATLTVGVSRTGFDTGGLDVELGPEDLIQAWS